jgi:hypothetical protein
VICDCIELGYIINKNFEILITLSVIYFNE